MNFLHHFLSSVTSFFGINRDNHVASKGNKRRRSINEETIVIEDSENSPPKKLRYNLEGAVKSSNGRIMKSSGTQTFSGFVTSRRIPSPQSGKSPAKSNLETIVVDDDEPSFSPSKFKNAYKAPKHVRSPHKTHTAGASSDVEIVTTIDVTGADNDVEEDKNKSSRFERKSRNMRDFSINQWAVGGTMSRDAYESLLGSVISSSAKQSMRKSSKMVANETLPVVDLTDENDSTVDVVSINLTRPSRSTQQAIDHSHRRTIVSPVVHSLSDTETTVRKPQPVARVNSFQEKIEGNKYLKPDLVSTRYVDYCKHLKKFIDMKYQLETRAKYESTVSQATLHDILEKRIQSHLKITDATIIDVEEEEIETTKPVLTNNMIAKVENAQNPKLNPNEVLVSKFKLDVRREDFMTLKGLNWLNDAIINFYMELIVERGQTNPNCPSVYAFSTFFFPALNNGYERVRRHTRRVDLFSKDIILIPVHLAVHWCMAKIDMKRKEITYYDSMLNSNQKVLNMLLDYLISELQDKKKEVFNSAGWMLTNEKDIPTQKNGSDCGVFACTFAEYSSRRSKFNFSQKDMPYIRNKMCYEILTGKLLT